MNWTSYLNEYDWSAFAYNYTNGEGYNPDKDTPSCFADRQIREDLTTPQKMKLFRFLCELEEAKTINPNHGEQGEVIST
jgi:hypothetical protein